MAAKERFFDIDGLSVRLSSPDKLYFASLGLTKADVAEYFIAVGAGLVAGLERRPTTLERWPSGVSDDPEHGPGGSARGAAFYQKSAPKGLPDWVETASVTFPSGRTVKQVMPTNLASCISLVNLGTLRFHPWPVTAPDLDNVDQLRIDLDPMPGVEFREVVHAALIVREVLADAGLISWPKTSGGDGLHLYVPVVPLSFVDARHAVIAIGREAARRSKDLITICWWKEDRGTRVFIDFNQMARDRLMTSPYSIRPTQAGRISAPLRWDEVDSIEPDDFTIRTMPARFQRIGDPWVDMYAHEPFDCAQALSWYERDATNGNAEMPYPPEYPKMPGEPPRVAPSRAKRDSE